LVKVALVVIEVFCYLSKEEADQAKVDPVGGRGLEV
jgi:hypothetical protein